MTKRKGTIAVKTADIFPIIKKWLYSEHNIFLRELVSNSTDAITKRSVMAQTQNEEIPTGKILVEVNKGKKTISISDNGLGMTEEEVEKYLAQLAFSGAEEFVKKIKESDKEADADVIGKFGLGFYSVFMVADKVVVESLSMQKGATPVKWTCKGETDYTFTNSDKKEVGTTVTIHVSKDGEEFLDEYKVNSTLRNFCSYMPYEISVKDIERFEENAKKMEEQNNRELKKDEVKVEPLKPTIINPNEPLWKRDPKDLKDEDYQDFFQQLFPMEPMPLFWIHLKVDHPFTLEGILYFPKLNKSRPVKESNIKLYCKHVFVSDNVKNIIPEFLSLLKGALDSSDIPLNVSRSALQGDPNIKKISGYIIKKVADALKKLFKKDRKKFEDIWEDIGLFVKYGVISENKFDELMRDMVIFKNSEDKYVTFGEYRESIPEKYKEKIGDKVLYFEKEIADWSLRKQLLDEGVHSIETDEHIDPHFMQHVEMHKKGDKEIKFASIDAEVGNLLTSGDANADDMKIKDLFKKVLVGEVEDDSKDKDKDKEDSAPESPVSGMEIEVQKLKDSKSPAYFKVDEHSKRMQNMMRSMGQDYQFPLKKTLVVNPNNPLIQNALTLSEKGNNSALVEKICHYVEDLALISSEGLKNEDKEGFVNRGQDLVQELIKHAL